MTTTLQRETMVQSLIRRIVLTCNEHGTSPSNQHAAVVMKGVILHPDTGLEPDKDISKEGMDTIVNTSARLLNENPISVQTAALQVLFRQQYKSIGELLKLRQRDMDDVMKEVEESILDMKCHTRSDYEGLYRQVVSCMLLRSNMGSPTNINVVKETTAALESVLPPEELGTFISLTRSRKLDQLHELALLTMGIRLFNRSVKKGGQEIPNLPLDLENILQRTTQTIQQHFHSLLASAYTYSKELINNQPSNQDHTHLEQLSANAYQSIMYLQRLQTDIVHIAAEFSHTRHQFELRQERLLAIIEGQDAVSTDVVFPQFSATGSLWQTMQGHLSIVSSIAHLLSQLVAHMQLHTVDALPDEMPKSSLSDSILIYKDHFDKLCMETLDHLKRSDREGDHYNDDTDKVSERNEADRSLVERPLRQSDFSKKHDLLKFHDPLTTHNFEKLPLQCEGFCPVTLTKTGAIVPICRHIVPSPVMTQPVASFTIELISQVFSFTFFVDVVEASVPILNFGNMFYGFLDQQAAKNFADAPDRSVKELLDIVRRRLELPELLRMHHALASRQDIKSIVAGGEHMAVKSDATCQTDTHVIEQHIDKKYEWNEWELRRKALRLANLRQKKTHSTQTNNSHFRRENATQVYLPKPNGTQTKRDGYTNTSKPVTYMRGLRGGQSKDAIPHQVVDLTLDIGGIALEPKDAKYLSRRSFKQRK
eukprot:gene397-3743_t